MCQFVSEPAVPRRVEEDPAAKLVGDAEPRVDPGLHRPLLQEARRERVDRAHLGPVDVVERALERLELLALGLGHRALQLGPDADPELARRLLGERDGDDALDVRPRAEHGEQPVDEDGRLPRPRPGLDEVRPVEPAVEARGEPSGRVVLRRPLRHQSIPASSDVKNSTLRSPFFIVARGTAAEVQAPA
jgi:hypothetical protein